EHHAERENVGRSVAGELWLKRYLAPFRCETGGQNFFGETFNRCERITRARARRRLAAEVGRGEHVVAGDLVGTAHFLHGRYRAEGDDSARIISRLKQTDVVGTQTKLRIGLSRYAIGPAEKGEIIHVGRSKISLERTEDVTQRHVHALRFDTIDFQPKLRNVGAKGRQVVRQGGRLIRLYHHRESLRLQIIEAGVAAIL